MVLRGVIVNSENIIYFAAIVFCAMVFTGISIWCFKSGKPVSFWAGEKIPVDFVSDVKKYNCANGIMWLIYGLCWFFASIVGLFSIGISAVMVVVLCLGIGILILIQLQIRKQYFKK